MAIVARYLPLGKGVGKLLLTEGEGDRPTQTVSYYLVALRGIQNVKPCWTNISSFLKDNAISTVRY